MLAITRAFTAIVSLLAASNALAIDADVTVPPQARQWMLSMPRPTYPEEALAQRITGRGKCEIAVDISTGRATRVVVIESTGSRILDTAAAKAFIRWRARPGKIAGLRVPFTFTFAR